jgi:hypothetical protein
MVGNSARGYGFALMLPEPQHDRWVAPRLDI